jgi:hypothetical protein
MMRASGAAAFWRFPLKLRFLCAAAALFATAGMAEARQDPPAKPSGIVVHLFGPNSVSSQFLPSAASPPAHGNHQAPANAAAQEPGFGGILRQMFVTGDPNREPGQALSKGRALHPLAD